MYRRDPRALCMRALATLLLSVSVAGLLSCSSPLPDPNTFVLMIESSPQNLDPRVGVDAQSERIDELIFDALVHRDEHFELKPWLAERWEQPDPLTYVFHLRRDVRFHDGRGLTARDVKWTFDSLLSGKVRSAKTGTYQHVANVEARDNATVIFHLKDADSSLLWNLSDGAIGIVPEDSGDEMSRHPIGSGPFRFVSAEADSEVVVERNPDYWGEKAKLPRVRFAVVPDVTTRALELRKGSADACINALTADMVTVLEQDRSVEVLREPGSIYAYIALNLRDPILRDVRVRQALAYAIDREPLIHNLWRDQVRPAASILPPQSWAFNSDGMTYPHDLTKAAMLLDEAGYPLRNGERFHLTMKTSSEEMPRLIASVLQQQLREVGIVLEIRSFEFATFFADVTKGAFQVYSLRWIGGNQDPDIFQTFHSSRMPPNGTNRGFYTNPKVDGLIDAARVETDLSKRRAIYFELQRILAEELPYIPLWYFDNVLVHTHRTKNLALSPSGSYDFLRTATLE